MEHHCSCHAHHGLDCAFAYAVLEAGVCATESDGLIFAVQGCDEVFCGEGSFVAVVAVDGDTAVESFLLEGELCLDGVGCV